MFQTHCQQCLGVPLILSDKCALAKELLVLARDLDRDVKRTQMHIKAKNSVEALEEPLQDLKIFSAVTKVGSISLSTLFMVGAAPLAASFLP